MPFIFRGTLEGKKNLENYRQFLEDPQLKYTGLQQRYSKIYAFVLFYCLCY